MNEVKRDGLIAASEARYRSILEASPDGIAITDLGGRVTMLSARAAAMLRVGQDSEVIGKSITDFIVPEDRSRAMERIGLLIAGKRTGPGEYRGLRADGDTFDIDVNAEFITDDRGAPSEILFMVRDVSERTQAREALQRSNVLLRSIIETVPARIFWKDRNLRYLGCNTQFARDAGEVSPADVVGKTDLDMPWQDQAEQYRADDRSVMESGIPKIDYEEPQTTPSGETFWLGTSKVPLRNEAGGVAGILGIYQDITVRKLADDALRESLTEKESLLKEVHHRVKNNLQVINSLLRLEAGRSQEPAVRRALGEMQGRVLSMAVLHETLYRTRTFGRVDLAPYLRELARQFFKAHATGVTPPKLTLDLAPVEVPVDQGVPCGLMLSELMSNSFKHAFGLAAGGELRVVLRREANREVLLQVADNGPGLPEDFEARRTRSLGMQLVADLARQIGGRMEIGSGPGACFNIRFASATGERRRPGKGARQP